LRIALDIVAPSVGMERRRSPRTEIELECTLTRDKGGPIAATTVDLGPGGMCVRCERPLAEDELIEFAIPGRTFDGRARVLREQKYKVYALRFEEIAETQREALTALAGGSA
jgi:c-di-GMP-binding flagellar brake protein YcgR